MSNPLTEIEILRKKYAIFGYIPRIYLSGPMSGIQDFNYPYFDRVEKALKDYFHGTVELINPANIGRANPGASYERLMELDLAEVRRSNIVLMLPGSKSSKGAKRECLEAFMNGIPVMKLDLKTRIRL